MRVLVTGVSGFAGGHLAEFLREAQPALELYGLVRPHGAATPELAAGVRAIEADLDDAGSVTAALDAVRPERVIHLAGQSSVQHSWGDPGATLRTNVMGVVHLLDGLRRLAAGCHVLVVGSAEEYGAVAATDLPLHEALPLRPTSPYAVSKAAQALLALQYAATPGLSVVLTRTFPHTGPRRGEAFAESSFARQLAEIEVGLRPPVLEVGNLEAVRDFTDVRDVVRAYWALVERGVSGEAYNVCSGRGYRIRELLERLVGQAEVGVEIRVAPERLRPADVPVLVGNPAKLVRATGWVPRLELDRTLADLLTYWRERVRVAVGRPAEEPRA